MGPLRSLAEFLSIAVDLLRAASVLGTSVMSTPREWRGQRP